MTKSVFFLFTVIVSVAVTIAFGLYKRRMPTASPSRVSVIEAETWGRISLLRVDSHEYVGTERGGVVHHEGCPCKHNH